MENMASQIPVMTEGRPYECVASCQLCYCGSKHQERGRCPAPNGSMEAMFPLAYSRAQHLSGILYCFAVPVANGGAVREVSRRSRLGRPP